MRENQYKVLRGYREQSLQARDKQLSTRFDLAHTPDLRSRYHTSRKEPIRQKVECTGRDFAQTRRFQGVVSRCGRGMLSSRIRVSGVQINVTGQGVPVFK